MKNCPESVSAFSVYSEKFKQKKKPKVKEELTKINKHDKPIKKKIHVKNKELTRMHQMNEIGFILNALSEQSSLAAQGLELEVTENAFLKQTIEKRIKENLVKKHNLSKGSGKINKNLTNGKLTKNELKKPKKNTKQQEFSLKEKSNGQCEDTPKKKAKVDMKTPSSNIHCHSKKSSHSKISLESGDPISVLEKISSHETSQHRKGKLIKKKKTKVINPTANDEHTKNELTTKSKQILKVKGMKKPNVARTKCSKLSMKNGQLFEITNGTEESPFYHKSQNEAGIEKSTGRRLKTEVDPKAINIHWTNNMSSKTTSKSLFEWLILPVKESDFMNDYWEKQPLLIQREGNRNYYSELLSTPRVDAILRENNIFFTKHLDVTSYTNGERETHNLTGRAQANVVWDFYSNGCSVRLLNPQAFVPKIHAVNAMLQEYFGCFVGANVYLTPPNSQGFAPHFDDIEAFVLQIEGKKHWKVYTPSSDSRVLPRESSPNFKEEDLDEPFLDVVLEPGDLLYFPRGFIHQANTVEGEHSLHITLSAYQKTAWVDLLEKTLPLALKRAAQEDVEFRRGLPHDYLGLEYHGSQEDKSQFANTALRLVERLGHYVSQTLGAGVDLMGAQFMHDALPPIFTPDEKGCSGLGGGLKMKQGGELVNRVEIDMNTKIKLIRANVCRLVEEDEEVRLYHCLDNPLEYHAEEPQFLVLPQEGLSIITFLFQNYPDFVHVKDLPHDNDEELLTLVSDLWDAGILLADGLQEVSSPNEMDDSD